MITERAIQSATKSIVAGRSGSIELTDPGARGEGRLKILFRKRPNGVTVEWYACWYRDGRRMVTKLGSHPTLTLAEARRVFREKFAKAISNGENPVGPRARAARRGKSVGELFEAYLGSLEAQGKPSAKNARRLLLGPGGAAVAIGADRPAADVRKADIIPWLAEIHGRGAVTYANLARSYVRAAFEFGVRSGSAYALTAGADFGLETNPAASIIAPEEAYRARDRHLSPQEVQLFWSWLLEAEGVSPHAAAAAKLMIITGQRPGEILQLSEAHYDAENAMLAWKTTKNGRPHSIPLPRQAVDILDGLSGNRYGLYFPSSKRPAEHCGSFVVAGLIGRFVLESGVEHFISRDLRRTWKTLAGRAGLTKEIRDRLQNHAMTDVSTRHYDRWDYLPEKRDAIAKWADHFNLIISNDRPLDPAGLMVSAASMGQFLAPSPIAR